MWCLPTIELLGASLPIPRVLAGRVPRLPRYYQGTATSCRPSRRTSFPSLGGTTGTRRFRSRRRGAWPAAGLGLVTRYPRPGRLPWRRQELPSSWETPIPVCPCSSTPAGRGVPDLSGTLAWPPLRERRRRRREDFRGSIAWLSGSPPTYHDVGCPSPRKARFQVLVRLSWAGFYPQGSDNRFQFHYMWVILLFQAFLAQSPFRFPQVRSSLPPS